MHINKLLLLAGILVFTSAVHGETTEDIINSLSQGLEFRDDNGASSDTITPEAVTLTDVPDYPSDLDPSVTESVLCSTTYYGEEGRLAFTGSLFTEDTHMVILTVTGYDNWDSDQLFGASDLSVAQAEDEFLEYLEDLNQSISENPTFDWSDPEFTPDWSDSDAAYDEDWWWDDWGDWDDWDDGDDGSFWDFLDDWFDWDIWGC